MSLHIKRHVPNAITCLNLLSGCVGCVAAFRFQYDWALFYIALSALFDFCDGMAARLLHVHSVIGKDLDSLADAISFGMLPSVIVYSLLQEKSLQPMWLSYAAFFIAAFSVLRLARFNNDTRQTTSFIGLAVPANALFWGSLVVGAHDCLLGSAWHPALLFALVALSCWLLVCELPMFSFKVKDLTWRSNWMRVVYLVGCAVLLPIFGVLALAWMVVWYVALSLFLWLRSRSKTAQPS